MKETQGIIEFVQVVTSGSFSEAARRLGMSKAYVSQCVSQLEERLGARLLQRTTRKLTLTAAGELYLQHAREVVRLLREGEERVRDIQKSPKGLIKASIVDGGLGEWYLAPALARFTAQNLGVELRLDISSRLVDLVAEGFDFAIRVGKLGDSSLIARKLTAIRYGLYASPAYLQRAGGVATPEQLQQHNCLTGASERWPLSRGEQKREFKPKGSWHSKSGQALIAAAREGLGIARAASFYAEPALAAGQLVELLSDWTREETGVWIVYPSNTNLPHRVSCAINHMLAEFRGQPPWS